MLTIKQDKSKLDVAIGDIRQMATYALKRNAKSLCLIYPLYRKEELEDTDILLNIKPYNDESKQILCYIKKVPFVLSDDINKTKESVKKILKEVI